MPSQDASDIQQTNQLSDVTLSTLQLIQQPFGPVVSDTETYSDETSLEQLADVKQSLVTGDDLLLILGEPGAGKSVLLNQLGNNSGQNIQCFAVKGSPRFSTLNLFAGMLEAFKRTPPEQLKDILDELIPCLQTMVARDTLSAIVLDDADKVTETELTQLLSGMLYINSQDETLMRVALAAPPEFEDRIPDLLPEGADLPYSSLTIEGMDRDRAADYLAFRLQLSGYDGDLPFSDPDLDDMIRHSGGFPGGLHAEAVSALHQLFDPMQHPPPQELSRVASPSFLQSRNGKFGLGALAILLILGGLLMFTPDAADDDERYADNSVTNSDALTGNSSGSQTPPDPFAQTDLATDSDTASDQSSTTEATASSDQPSDRPVLRVIEERKVVPFTSEAIESLVPEIKRPSPPSIPADNSATSTGTDSDSAPDTAATASPDSTEDSTQSLSDEPAPPAETSSASSSSAESATDEPLDILTDAQLLTEEPAQTATEQTDAAPPQIADIAAPPTDSGNNPPDVDPELADILESPTWILVQDSNLITVQMSASRDRPSIESFLKRNRNVLPPPNSIYTFQRQGETWFALLHGLYASFEEAQSAVEQMPDSAITDQPWIRNVGRVQDVLKAQ